MGRRFLLPALALMLTLSAPSALAKTVDVEVAGTGDTFTDANVSINPGDSHAAPTGGEAVTLGFQLR
jgi:hypothetical protein